MLKIVNKFEKVIYAILMIMMMIVLITAIADLVVFLFISLVDVSPWILETSEVIAVLGSFLLILIGVELLDTIKAYFSENTIHVEIVVLLAIIAIARKVILLDPSKMTSGYEFGVELMGIGVIVAGLATGYYLIKKAGITISIDSIGKKEG
jgi:uncharacterized membrane protein (DUF373 family)